MPRYLSSYTINFYLNDITTVVNKKFDSPVENIAIKTFFDFNNDSSEVYFLIKHNGEFFRWSLKKFLKSVLHYHQCIYKLEKIYYNKPWWIPWCRKIIGFKLKITKTKY